MSIFKGSHGIRFQSVEESGSGDRWKTLFSNYWPQYQKWFLSEGDAARPSYTTCRKALRKYMPEIIPTWERLTDLAGGGDMASRFLSLFCPPPYLTGCTQAVWTGEESALIRNYDYNAERLDGIILKTRWNQKTVIAMTDAGWGVLDGINDSGLAVSLAFGGRINTGVGFGIPIILRYVLEFCDNTDQAVEVLKSVLTHMSYNVTVLDREQRFVTVFITPDRTPVVRQIPVATNHQGKIEWPRHAWATATLERESVAYALLANLEVTLDGMISGFLTTPIYNLAHHRGFGTLYTAVYRPMYCSVEYIWPTQRLLFNMNQFTEAEYFIDYPRPILA